MGLIDNTPTAPVMTDDQKNEFAAKQIIRILTRASRMQRQMLRNVQRLIKNAPGNKAAIFSKMGSDEAEATTMVNSMKSFVNAHKGAKDKDIDI